MSTQLAADKRAEAAAELAVAPVGQKVAGPAHLLEREALLAPYATRGSQSRGRLVPEPGCPMRSPYQRDRDRIVHATAFRRLTHKTQVFLYHEGDHYRTRLTHTLEVAQIARALARLLRLDEDLAEAVALAHDLGHPPFGHAGERALDEAMSDWGGFDHNAQSLKVVTRLEYKYAAWNGLNLSWETLEGIIKHNGPLIQGAQAVGDATVNSTPSDIPAAILKFDAAFDLELDRYASAEAQVAAIADDIAYNNHDIDDGLRAGLISLDELGDIALARRFLEEIGRCHPGLTGHKVIYEVNRRMITQMVEDAADEARRRLSMLAPQSPADIAAARAPVVAFSEMMLNELNELRQFLFAKVYRHHKVMRVMDKAQSVVQRLFAHFLEKPETLPGHWRDEALAARDNHAKAGVICDFVAGMTDRYAIDEYSRLFDATPDLR